MGENEGDKTAAEFCKSCGCGEVPCKDDNDKIKLTSQDQNWNCARIEKKGLCKDKVENEGDKTAADFCKSCGCGNAPSNAPSIVPSKEPSVVPSNAPSHVPSKAPSVVPSKAPSEVPSDTPSVPSCKDDNDKIKLTSQDQNWNCARIERKGLCKDKVENEGDKTA